MPRQTSLSFLLLALAACGAPPSQSGTQAPAPAAQAPLAGPGALSRFSSEQLLVLPLQGLASADSTGWRAVAGTERVVIPRVDSLFEAELTGRRLAAKWSFPSTLSRAARRNPTYLTDPYAIRATPAVLLQLRKPDDALAEPVASQLRALAGVSDARYALIPLDLRFDRVESGGGRSAIRLALVDVRTARVTWWGEVQGEPRPAYAPDVLDDLIRRAADLIIPR